jgi:hypothetical protein
MKNVTYAPKAAIGVAAVGIAAAISGVLILATPALAVEAAIEGSATVVLDFTTAGEVGVEVTTQNLSTVSAYGGAVILAPDGTRYDFGPKFYTPGEVWVYSKVLSGYDCDDLTEVSAAAFGFANLNDDSPEWTSGVVTYPDSRVTVIGCDDPAPPPTDTDTDVTPTASTPSTVVVPRSGNTLPPSMTDGALVVAPAMSAPLGATLLVAGAALFTLSAGILMRGRRLRSTHPA